MESVWSDSCKFDKRDTLLRDIECDVLIIGAGIAGILTNNECTRILFYENASRAVLCNCHRRCRRC